MKTDDLIAMLGRNVEPVGRGQVRRAVLTAALIGAAAALAAMFVLFGARMDLSDARAIAYLLLKLAFTMATVAIASIYLIKLAAPGGEQRAPIALAAAPFTVVILLAVISLAFAPLAHWKDMAVGDRWLECLLSIPIIAIVPFAVIVWTVRKMAPTDLTRAGALVGLVAGGISATGYALHCTDDSLSFVALWYGGTMALCTLAGAKLGPRLLRW
ncbi:MAG: NrsF family protein [Hyphomicrobiaceae bacterium]